MSDIDALQAEAARFQDIYRRLHQEVGKVIVGQSAVIDAALTALFAGGNLLVEGVPGLGKTVLIKTLGQVLDLDFKRIQFTPDLMPADIIGTNILNTGADGQAHFEFRRGPIFTQLLLADEINRATPKTQSALLETMQEHTVTAGGHTHVLTEPFFVMATQNPIEQEGTYPLPEAQLDRFLFKVQVPFVNRAEMNEILNRTTLRQRTEVGKVLDGAGILEMRALLDKVVVAPPLRDHAVRLVLATHPDSEEAPEAVKKYTRWGASPRAVQALIAAARVRALADGRAHVAFEDVRAFALPVLQHRILLNYDGQAEGVKTPDLVAAVLRAVSPKES